MKSRRGVTIIELVVLALVLIIVIGIFPAALGRARTEAKKSQCKGHLAQIAEAMLRYRDTLGGKGVYAMPGEAFRGDCFLAHLCWTGMLTDPAVLKCPGTRDSEILPSDRAAAGDLRSALAVKAGAVSYAGLCRGLTGALTHRNTKRFHLGAINPAVSAIACDDNEGLANHWDGINVVFFDGHVEFFAGLEKAVYGVLGKENAKFNLPGVVDTPREYVAPYMDSGE